MIQLKVCDPAFQGQRVAGSQRFRVAKLDATAFGGTDHPIHRNELSVWKHVGNEETRLLSSAAPFRAVLPGDDAVVEQETGRRQHAGQVTEVHPELGGTDVLEHADRRDRVETSVHFPIVALKDRDTIVYASLLDQVVGKGGLFRTQGDANRCNAILLSGMRNERSPAGPDIEESLARAKLELATDQIELAQLGLLKGVAEPST